MEGLLGKVLRQGQHLGCMVIVRLQDPGVVPGAGPIRKDRLDPQLILSLRLQKVLDWKNCVYLTIFLGPVCDRGALHQMGHVHGADLILQCLYFVSILDPDGKPAVLRQHQEAVTFCCDGQFLPVAE